MESTQSSVRWWQALLIGIATAILGLLPWLSAGLTLPLQNLWAIPTMPEDMPKTLLPFSQYYASSVAALILVGSVVAGLVGRWLRPRLSRGGRSWISGGLLMVQVLAIVQTSVVVNAGLIEGTLSTYYLVGLADLTSLSVLLGLLAFWVISVATKPGALIALALGAVALMYWWAPTSGYGTFHYNLAVHFQGMLSWLAPALLGVAIVWCGISTAKSRIAAGTSLVILWILPAVIDAAMFVIGSRAFFSEPRTMPRHFTDAFVQFLLMDAWKPAVIALLVAATALIMRRVVSDHALVQRQAS